MNNIINNQCAANLHAYFDLAYEIYQEEDKTKRKAELTIEFEKKVAAKKTDIDEEEGEDK